MYVCVVVMIMLSTSSCSYFLVDMAVHSAWLTPCSALPAIRPPEPRVVGRFNCAIELPRKQCIVGCAVFGQAKKRPRYQSSASRCLSLDRGEHHRDRPQTS